MLTFVIAAFGWSFLLVAASAASTNIYVSNKTTAHINGKGTTVATADDKCSTVINGNYYAGTSKEIKTILRGIQAQLSDVQEQLREIKTDNRNKTGERRNIQKLL